LSVFMAYSCEDERDRERQNSADDGEVERSCTGSDQYASGVTWPRTIHQYVIINHVLLHSKIINSIKISRSSCVVKFNKRLCVKLLYWRIFYFGLYIYTISYSAFSIFFILLIHNLHCVRKEVTPRHRTIINVESEKNLEKNS